MGKSRWMTGSLVGLALLIGSVAPAQARPRYDRGHDRHWGHHRDRGNRFGFGDAVGVAALIGAVAIVASSMAKDKKAAPNPDNTAPPPANGTDYGADVRSDDDFSDIAGTHGQSDQMTDACAVAARDEAQGQNGGYAEVRRMDEPRAAQDGYNIDGEVESRASYRAPTGTTRRFTCTIKDGRVAQVYLSRDIVMR
jgi:hypothetical protein